MPDRATFQVLNAKEVEQAFRLAPKQMRRGIRREFNRGKRRFRNVARRALFSGGAGITLPKVFRGRAILEQRRASGVRKDIQLAHIKTRTIDKPGFFVLFSYLSKFSEFHEQRLRPIFDGMFKLASFAITARLRKETARLAQLAIDGKLKLNRSRFER